MFRRQLKNKFSYSLFSNLTPFNRFARQSTFVRWNSTLEGLPFKISTAEAYRRFAEYRGFLEVSPSPQKSDSSLIVYESNPVKAVFLPFHSASIENLTASFTGEQGKNRTVYDTETTTDDKGNITTRTVSRTVIDWEDCSGTLPLTDYPFGTCATQIFASFSYPRDVIEPVLRSPSVIEKQKITKEMLKTDGDKVIYPHAMKISYALSKINSALYRLEKSRAEKYIERKFSADHSRVHRLDVHLSEADIQLFSYHVSAYIHESKLGGCPSYKVINAYDGDFGGNKIYSVPKSMAFGATLGAIFSFGLTAVFRPYLILPQILLRVAAGSSISSLLSGALAKFSRSTDQEYASAKQNEINENDTYEQSDGDIERETLANNLNDENTQSSTKKIQLTEDEFRLFKLDPNVEVTPEKLKEAYYREIKNWHPDFFRGKNPQVAAEITKQLNSVYANLSKKFSAKP